MAVEMMKKAARWLTSLSILSAALLLLRPRSGLLRVLLLRPKAAAESFSRAITAAGVLGAVLSLTQRDISAALAGLAGGLVSGWHLVQVSAAHKTFHSAFGGADLPGCSRPNLFKNPPPVVFKPDVVIPPQTQSGTPLAADLWLPPASVAPSGVGVVYLHGGGWHFTGKDYRTRTFFRRLAGLGHAILDLEYPLAPRAQLTEMLSSIHQAVGWMKTAGTQYGVHPQKIVLMGGSAGAHLALLAAYMPDAYLRAVDRPEHEENPTRDLPESNGVQGVISYYGPVDLLELQHTLTNHFSSLPDGRSRMGRRFINRWEKFARASRFLPPGGSYLPPAEYLPDLLGGTPDELPERYRWGSPIYHVGPHCPPTLLLQGAHDLTGIVPGVQRLHKALRAAGVPSLYVEFTYTEHAFDLISPSRSPASRSAVQLVARFLSRIAENQARNPDPTSIE